MSAVGAGARGQHDRGRHERAEHEPIHSRSARRSGRRSQHEDRQRPTRRPSRRASRRRPFGSRTSARRTGCSTTRWRPAATRPATATLTATSPHRRQPGAVRCQDQDHRPVDEVDRVAGDAHRRQRAPAERAGETIRDEQRQHEHGADERERAVAAAQQPRWVVVVGERQHDDGGERDGTGRRRATVATDRRASGRRCRRIARPHPARISPPRVSVPNSSRYCGPLIRSWAASEPNQPATTANVSQRIGFRRCASRARP